MRTDIIGCVVCGTENPISRTYTDFQVIKRYMVSEPNAKIVDGQDISQDNIPVKVMRTNVESSELLENLKDFSCPWCQKAYQINIQGGNAIFNCIKCHKGIFIMRK